MLETDIDGRYKVIRRLGSGGMGEVYLVEHLALGRLEALKILHWHVARSEEQQARLRREARAIHRLQHPNIVSVYDFGRADDGRFYLSTEFAAGVPLDEELAHQGPFAITRALHILRQICAAIGHAHERGVIHRDIKPSNIILTEHRGHRDRVKVLDFGIAKITASDHQENAAISDANIVLGTPGYIAPECLRALPFDERADIYAVGSVAMDLFTGSPVFSGNPIEVARAHMSRQPPRPSDRVASLPAEVDELVLHCLAKKPEERIGSADELGAAISRVASRHGEGVPKRNSGFLRWLTESARDPDTTSSGVGTILDPTTLDVAMSGDDATHSEAGWLDGNNPEARRDSVRQAHGAVAEALLDAGCNADDLVLVLADARDDEDEVRRIRSIIADVDARSEALEQRTREREPPLRLALRELRSRLEHSAAPGDPVARQMDERVRRLEKRLAKIAEEQRSGLESLTERAIVYASRLDDAERELQVHYDQLAGLLAEYAPQFGRIGPVRDAITVADELGAWPPADNH